jgi:hypothetical protein
MDGRAYGTIAKNMHCGPAVDGALNMVAPSTMVGITARTGISLLRYLFP